jgi:hypothetical protein
MTVRLDFMETSAPRTVVQVVTGNAIGTMGCAQLDASPGSMVIFAIIHVLPIVRRAIVTDLTEFVLAHV